jgi:GMP synthase-like glutamine amidotransferase
MPTLILEHSDLSGADRLATLLRDRGHRLDVRRLHAGDDLPSDLDGIDAVVTCGGEADPTDEAGNAWMAPELDLLRAAHDSGRSVIGLCLGSQLLARALGGELSRLDGGIELGWHSVTLTPAGRDDPVFAGIGWDSVQLHHHRWQVSAPPPETSVLASSDRTPVQAWRCGMRSYGFQYHLEANRGRLAAWAAADADGVREAGTTIEALDAGTDAHWESAARLADHVFDRIAGLVMPLDRRVAGVARDLHH